MSPGGPGKKGRPKVADNPWGGGKRPKRSQVTPSPEDERRPRREFPPTGNNGKIEVRWGAFDVDGPWCLSLANAGETKELLAFIKQVEMMTIDEAQVGGHPLKDYKIHKLPTPDAPRRLVELGYDDMDMISRLRFNGNRCLFGFRFDNRFFALWYDRYHAIWPRDTS